MVPGPGGKAVPGLREEGGGSVSATPRLDWPAPGFPGVSTRQHFSISRRVFWKLSEA